MVCSVFRNCNSDIQAVCCKVVHGERKEPCEDGKIHILTDPFGKLKGYTIELHDNTEHYKTLALKERYNDELEKEVEEKTNRI